MKKTLIALAVAASAAAVSGSAMAWNEGGTGGEFSVGGTLSPSDTGLVWEVKTGTPVSNLDATLDSGDTTVDISIPEDVLVLGIRSVSGGFVGQSGISPQITYTNSAGGDALDIDSFSGGKANLTLTVNNESGVQIGELTTKLTAAAMYGYGTSKASLYASSSGYAFYGGIPTDSGSIVTYPQTYASGIDSTILDNWSLSSATVVSATESSMNDSGNTYEAFYVSALDAGTSLNIELENPLDNATSWVAPLTITVSYI
ncbi:fimbrial protein [Escherichia coli]|uniref:F4 family fimbrial subunit n=1 Tax=Escherichia coli TaxID=562 RepID=UPI001C4043E5|nr:fimbrial protein [Escherichia coli]